MMRFFGEGIVSEVVEFIGADVGNQFGLIKQFMLPIVVGDIIKTIRGVDPGVSI
jgi:hypothetical protein